MTAGRVLIVDDDRSNRALIELVLATEGLELASVASGEAALAAIAAQPPDLVLLDVMMPGMDGYEVVRRLKRDAATKHIPVIMLTTADDRASRVLGLDAGAEDFLGKPVDRAELCARVRNLLRLKAYSDYHDRHSQQLELEVSARTAELVESERLYRSTFDQAPVGIAHVDATGAWGRVNLRLCEMLGYSREELQRADVQALVRGPVPRELDVIRRMLAGSLDRHAIAEQPYTRRDGTTMRGRVNISVHRDASGAPQYLIEVIEDITALRELEAKLRQANKMEAVGNLASGVAHDFNNLMSVVLSYSELLAEGLNAGDPMRADLDQIRRAGERAAELTRQLLALGRRQVLQPQVVDLHGIVGGMESMLRRVLGANIQLVTTGVAAFSVVDPGQLEQVILNLAVNARDAMPDGGGLAIEVNEVVLDAEFTAAHVGVVVGPHVKLAVRDTGSGIDHDTQARMFEPFFTTKAVGKGAGLGLAMVFGIVQQSGGTIWVDSELGKGSTFVAYFPAASPDVAVARPPAVVDRRRLRGTETVLLVEDEERVRVLARTILRKCGYVVLEARDGPEALRTCEAHGSAIHLLVTDVMMPGINGRVLAERLVAMRPAMRVLFMSGYTDDAAILGAVGGATFAFLQKPLTPQSLASKVRQTLDRVGAA